MQDAVYCVSQGLWLALKEEYMPIPTEETWLKNAELFNLKWNFPNAIGAIDSKHVCIQAPANSRSAFYNYKDFFSFVLMAVADPNYKLLLVDIGEAGSQADSAVFQNSTFGKAFVNDMLNIPAGGKELPQYPEGGTLSLFLLGDTVFSLTENLMKPFSNPRVGLLGEPEQIFNYRLSCARRVVENAFGIMGQQFRLYHRRLDMTHEHTKLIVQATTVLHNFLMRDFEADSAQPQEKDARLPADGLLTRMSKLRGNNQTSDAAKNATQVV